MDKVCKSSEYVLSKVPTRFGKARLGPFTKLGTPPYCLQVLLWSTDQVIYGSALHDRGDGESAARPRPAPSHAGSLTHRFVLGPSGDRD